MLADFKILAFQYPELKILADFKILAFQNPEFKILADFKILALKKSWIKDIGRIQDFFSNILHSRF